METRIEHGDPRDVICAVAEKLHVDVVVMGSPGHGLIKRLVPFNSLFFFFFFLISENKFLTWVLPSTLGHFLEV